MTQKFAQQASEVSNENAFRTSKYVACIIKYSRCDRLGRKLDSRQVANGDLFIAIPGYETDGRAYIDAAIDQGAVAVIAESPGLAVEQRRGAVVVGFSGVREHLSEIAGNFFEHPSKGMTVIGVTGTNGKTSVTHIIAQLAQRLGQSQPLLAQQEAA